MAVQFRLRRHLSVSRTHFTATKKNNSSTQDPVQTALDISIVMNYPFLLKKGGLYLFENNAKCSTFNVPKCAFQKPCHASASNPINGW